MMKVYDQKRESHKTNGTYGEELALLGMVARCSWFENPVPVVLDGSGAFRDATGFFAGTFCMSI